MVGADAAAGAAMQENRRFRALGPAAFIIDAMPVPNVEHPGFIGFKWGIEGAERGGGVGHELSIGRMVREGQRRSCAPNFRNAPPFRWPLLFRLCRAKSRHARHAYPSLDYARDERRYWNGVWLRSESYSAANNSSAPPRSTETRRLTPCSTMVTPNRRCIRLIVTALWVTMR